MDERDHRDGLRILGVLAGIGASLPVGFFAFLALQLHSREWGVLFGGIALCLLIATVAVADGQAWGALVIALYGAGMALFLYAVAFLGSAYTTGGDATFVAFHVAIGVLGLTAAYGLARGHPAPNAPVEGPQ